MAKNKKVQKSRDFSLSKFHNFEITKNTKFNEIFGDDKTREVLEERGMHCMGCPFASIENIGEGAKSHGIDADELVKEINKKRKKSK